MAIDKQDLKYLKHSLEWLRDNTKLKEDNRTNAESEWCSIFNSLDIVDRAMAELSEREQANELLPLVSGSYSITFGRDLKCKIQIKNGEPKVEAAMNGWGDGISLSDITIEKL